MGPVVVQGVAARDRLAHEAIEHQWNAERTVAAQRLAGKRRARRMELAARAIGERDDTPAAVGKLDGGFERIEGRTRQPYSRNHEAQHTTLPSGSTPRVSSPTR